MVANDVALGGGQPPILIVSGPNAGGKTVLMKTVGLAALMARAGLLVAADARSRVGFFSDVRADIGDRQSVMGDLSTFSGHLAAVADILTATRAGGGGGAGAPRRADGGHQPRSGRGAGARHGGVAGRAPRAGDHHHPLRQPEGAGRKRRALRETPAMAYDLEALRPTFRLATGAPGRSYAFDIAARMGLPDALLARARELAGASSVGLESVIARLQARDAELVKQSERLAEAEAAAIAATATQREAAAALARRERELGLKSRDAVEAADRGDARGACAGRARRAAGRQRARRRGGRAELERIAAEALARLPAPAKPRPRRVAVAGGRRARLRRAAERRRRRDRASRRTRARQGQRRRDDRST